MLDGNDDTRPPPDGRQFDAVTRFEEPDEPGPGDLGPPVPETPDPSAGEAVHPRVQRLFWAMVLVYKVALLATSLGLFFLVFEGDRDLGGPLLAAGLLLFVYGIYRTRWAKAEVASIVGDDGPAGEGAGDEGAADGGGPATDDRTKGNG